MKTKTEEIFELTAPFDNPYQGSDKRLLFVCSAGLLRSATAANLFAKKGANTRSCGSSEYALIPISLNLIAWAEKIYFVKNSNYLEAKYIFKDYKDVLEVLEKKSIVLNIDDCYNYNNKELIKQLEEQVN